jgi:hypothetical protein
VVDEGLVGGGWWWLIARMLCGRPKMILFGIVKSILDETMGGVWGKMDQEIPGIY